MQRQTQPKPAIQLNYKDEIIPKTISIYFRCRICGRNHRSKKALQKHGLVHTMPAHFACEICSKAFATQADLKRHLICHTDKKPFTCEYCERPFNQIWNMKRHIRNVHFGGKPDQEDADLDTKSHQNGEKDPGKVCKEVSRTQQDLVLHPQARSNTKKFYFCKICEKNFTLSNNCLRHIRTIHGIDTLIRERSELMGELKPKNKDPSKKSPSDKPPQKNLEKSFPCEYCHRTFVCYGNVRRHLRVNHPGIYKVLAGTPNPVHKKEKKIFQCDSCPMNFPTNDRLSRHSLVHIETEPIYCEFCKKPFKWRANMLRHVRKVHGRDSNDL